MKPLYALVFTAALAWANPLPAADAIDVTKLTCAQFTAYNDDNRGLIMMWLEGYYTEEDEAPTIDFGKMASHLAQILIDCQANPGHAILEVADLAMEE